MRGTRTCERSARGVPRGGVGVREPDRPAGRADAALPRSPGTACGTAPERGAGGRPARAAVPDAGVRDVGVRGVGVRGVAPVRGAEDVRGAAGVRGAAAGVRGAAGVPDVGVRGAGVRGAAGRLPAGRPPRPVCGVPDAGVASRPGRRPDAPGEGGRRAADDMASILPARCTIGADDGAARVGLHKVVTTPAGRRREPGRADARPTRGGPGVGGGQARGLTGRRVRPGSAGRRSHRRRCRRRRAPPRSAGAGCTC